MELALKIVLPVLSVSIAFLVIFLDYVYRDKRTRRFKLILRALFMLSVTFLVVSVVVVVLDERANNAEKQQLRRELDRARQPLNDIYVTFRLDVSTRHPALHAFDSAIRQTVDAALRDAPMAQGVYISQKTLAGEILRLGIPPTSPLFPNMQRDPLAHFLLNYPAIVLDFYSAGKEDFSESSKADLVVPVLAVIDRSFVSSLPTDNPRTIGTIGIDVTSRTVFAEINDWRVPPQRWMSNGSIQSLPDLLKSTLVIRPRGYFKSDRLPVVEFIDEIRKTVRLNYVKLNIGGRHLHAEGVKDSAIA